MTGLVVTAEHVAERLKERSHDVATMVQGETASGVCTTELPAIAQLCKQQGAWVVSMPCAHCRIPNFFRVLHALGVVFAK